MKYFRYKLSTLKVHLIVTCLFSAVSYPLFCFAYARYAEANDDFYTRFRLSDMYNAASGYHEARQHVDELAGTAMLTAIIGGLALLCLFFSGFPILMKNFKYLYSKDHADKELSLPVSAKDRFLGDFFSGLTVYLAPHIVGVLTGVLMTARYNMAYMHLADFRTIMYVAMITGLLMCLEFYCTTLLTASVCGRLAKTVKLTLFLNLAVPVFVTSVTAISFIPAIGISVDVSDILVTDIITPLGLLLRFFSFNRYYNNSYENMTMESYLTSNIPFFIAVLIYCALVVIAAYLLIMHRRHERTGEAYVYRYARRCVSWFTVVNATCIIGTYVVSEISDNSGYLDSDTHVRMMITVGVIWLISSFLFYIAFEFSDKNKEKKLPKLAKFPAVALAGVLFVFIISKTQAFGAGYYVPKVTEVLSETVRLEVGDLDFEVHPDSTNYNRFANLHKAIVTEDSQAEDSYRSTSNLISFMYTLKDGRSFRRAYYLNDEYLKRAFELAKEEDGLRSHYDILTFYSVDTGSSSDRTITVNVGVAVGNHRTENIKVSLYEMTDALNADADAVTFEDAAETEWENCIFLTFDSRAQYRIYPGFTNTLDLLAQHGLDKEKLLAYLSDSSDTE